MKKGLIIILSVLIIVACIVFVIYKNSVVVDSEINDIYNMYRTDVDEGVSYLRTSEGFNSMSKDNQVSAMNELLEIYEKNNIIKNLYYDNDLTFTFTYNYGEIKGALGGVMLKDWDPMMD